ncbi:histone-lysine N-methyltransferase SETMAR-like [Harpegnathos saltator]|uniref:histone-lysine N-methyltransferase SETMAR-like n=1 Tax=Harpegnathos saltator TaxID=610380 RepID=UPI000DBEED0B|nr:histone-lysine N-methyltransferase SETMAR-like [Harpegnathos saltator]
MDEVPKHSPKANIHRRKLIVFVWWFSADIIHYSFMKPGQSITADVYCNQLGEIMKMLAIKQPRLINRHQALDHFLQGKIFNSQQALKNVFRNFMVTCSSGFFAAGIIKLSLRWQNPSMAVPIV